MSGEKGRTACVIPGFIRLPYPNIIQQEGGGEGGAAPALPRFDYASPTNTEETRSTYLPVALR